jgi:hypothetical protein
MVERVGCRLSERVGGSLGLFDQGAEAADTQEASMRVGLKYPHPPAFIKIE